MGAGAHLGAGATWGRYSPPRDLSHRLSAAVGGTERQGETSCDTHTHWSPPARPGRDGPATPARAGAGMNPSPLGPAGASHRCSESCARPGGPSVPDASWKGRTSSDSDGPGDGTLGAQGSRTGPGRTPPPPATPLRTRAAGPGWRSRGAGSGGYGRPDASLQPAPGPHLRPPTGVREGVTCGRDQGPGEAEGARKGA